MLLGAWSGLLVALLAASHGNGACQFPGGWTGRWFQSGVPQLISVNASVLETKGRCIDTDGVDKFLVEDRSDRCFRCMVIAERHPNVLQYKETYCDRKDTLANLCEKISGDAALFSMFRVGGAPAACPFDGGPPFSFTYSRGAGAADCRVPESRAEPCTDASRLLLRYQACPDVRGTESAVEELECVGSWRDGSVRYFVGRLEHRLAHSDEDRYRCFVYERVAGPGDAVSFNVAQSGDATCSGLLSASEGSRTMRLTNGGDRGAWTSRCEFPAWATEQPQWLSLDQTRSYRFSARNGTLRVWSGDALQKRLLCHALPQPLPQPPQQPPPPAAAATSAAPPTPPPTAAASPAPAPPTGLPDQQQLHQPPHETFFAVAHVTAGCRSGFVCMALYRRDSHVIELQESETWSTTPEDACQPPNFVSRDLPFYTLITPSPRRQACPRGGVYGVQPNGGGGSSCGALPTLAVGCHQPDLMQFLPAPCPEARPDAASTYSCHGSWEEAGRSLVVAAPMSRGSGAARRHCFVFSSAGGPRPLQVASVTHSCHRDVAASAAWAFNLTDMGECTSSSSAVSLLTSLPPYTAVLLVASLWLAHAQRR